MRTTPPESGPPAALAVAERSYIDAPGLHRHSFYQLILPRHGALLLRVAGERIAVGPVSWALIPPGAEHIYWAERTNRFLVADVAAPAMAAPDEDPPAADVALRPLDGRLTALADLLQSELRAGALAEPLLAESLAGYVGAAVRLALRPGARPAAPAAPVAARARDYLEARACEAVSLAEVAAAAGASVAHLQRSFRAAYGVTVVEYLQALRLRSAQALLRESDLPVEAVAAAVGFASPSYFTRLFARHVGVSPAAYRRRA